MFICIVLLLHYLINCNCLVFKDRHNGVDSKKTNKRATDDSDYEMINKEQLIQFNSGESEDKNFKKNQIRESVVLSSHTSAPDLNLIVRTKYLRIMKSDTTISHEYDYEELVQDYVDHSIEEAKSMNSYHVKQADTLGQGSVRLIRKALFLNALSHNCTKHESEGIGIRAVKCLIDQYKYDEISTKELFDRLWDIVKIWCFIYLIVAIPLWVTRGWCCCCLTCKFFKPHLTIQRAKIYLISNPPGVFKDETGETQYTASEKEKEKYEEFEHLLRTI